MEILWQLNKKTQSFLWVFKSYSLSIYCSMKEYETYANVTLSLWCQAFLSFSYFYLIVFCIFIQTPSTLLGSCIIDNLWYYDNNK